MIICNEKGKSNGMTYISSISGFKYQPQLSEGILRLQETGVLAELKTKWWKERKGGGACAVSNE